ncbi:GL15475 [Drosophila persimilis]|uniref:GL15475 n=1 Tax=Drosophila persimilis TaxID=7234 RepID=B4H6P1_DROPE|nr:GL15475 [Drosophila persimilis]
MATQLDNEDMELYPQHNDHHKDRSVRSLTPEELPGQGDTGKTGDVVGCCG